MKFSLGNEILTYARHEKEKTQEAKLKKRNQGQRCIWHFTSKGWGCNTEELTAREVDKRQHQHNDSLVEAAYWFSHIPSQKTYWLARYDKIYVYRGPQLPLLPHTAPIDRVNSNEENDEPPPLTLTSPLELIELPQLPVLSLLVPCDESLLSPLEPDDEPLQLSIKPDDDSVMMTMLGMDV
jgi:hypothetical protein